MVEQYAHVRRVRRCAGVEGGRDPLDDVRELPAGRDEHASSLLRDHASLAAELLDRLPCGHPSHPVVLHQLGLGRQLVPRLEVAAVEGRAELVGDLTVGGPVCVPVDPVQRHWSRHLDMLAVVLLAASVYASLDRRGTSRAVASAASAATSANTEL